MSVESELLELVKALPAFSAPICTSLGLTIADGLVLNRLSYGEAPQNVKTPYLYWTGPFRTDVGQTSKGVSGTAKADFWFFCQCSALTDAMIWTEAIRSAVQAALDDGPIILLTFRITSAIFIDRMPVTAPDQVVTSAQEFPTRCATIGFTFGYQATNS